MGALLVLGGASTIETQLNSAFDEVTEAVAKAARDVDGLDSALANAWAAYDDDEGSYHSALAASTERLASMLEGMGEDISKARTKSARYVSVMATVSLAVGTCVVTICGLSFVCTFMDYRKVRAPSARARARRRPRPRVRRAADTRRWAAPRAHALEDARHCHSSRRSPALRVLD